MAIAAMFSVQTGSALSVSLFDQIGPAGTAWLRLSFGALMFLAISRPVWREINRADWRLLLALGFATGLVTLAFLSAIQRLPLGTAVAIEFLGPLTVAAWQSPDRKAITWPVVAFAGILAITQPWQHSVDLIGVGFAAASALGWGAYIWLTQKVGDRYPGIQGLAITIPVAALTAALFGVPASIGSITWQVVIAAIGLAVLLPVLPFALEMLALRRMSYTAFGTLMALEPAFGMLVGWALLAQPATYPQLAGMALVVFAGIAASRIQRTDISEG